MRTATRLARCVGCLMLWTAAEVAAADAYRTDEPLQWVLPSLGGESLELASLRGQWVVLNYWATWCAPCRKEIPELSELHEERGDVTVLGLAFEEAAPEDLRKFLQAFHASYPILLVDVYAPPEPFGAPRVLPTTVIVDPRGFAVKGFPGPVTRAMLEAFIDEEAEP